LTTGHVVPVRTYLLVFLALMAGTALTVLIATIDLGPWNTPVALGIAVTKAVLVVLFFMHMKYSGRIMWLTVAAAVFWLLNLIAGTAADYLSRGFLGNPGT
jgi:cytochrome c oxidase subunit IV